MSKRLTNAELSRALADTRRILTKLEFMAMDEESSKVEYLITNEVNNIANNAYMASIRLGA